MVLDTQEKIDKAIEAIKEYNKAVVMKNKAEIVCQDKLGLVKSMCGVQNVDEAMVAIGKATVYGLPDNR